MMITIGEWMKQNNVHKSIIEKGRGVLVISVNSDDKYDTVVNDRQTGDAIYMKKITDFNFQLDTDKTKAFVIGTDQWKKMTTKNLFMSKLRNTIDQTEGEV